MKINIPSRLADAELATEVQRLAGCERETTASLIAHLAEFDARRLYLGAGFSSLFTYCTEVLHLSEHEAYNRIEAACAARRFPLVLDMLGEGSLNLTTARLLAPHLTGENHQELLVAASHKRKRDVEELLARHFPQPAIPSSIRKLPAAQRLPASLPERGSTMTDSTLSPGRPAEIPADIMSSVASAHPVAPGPAPSPTRRSIGRSSRIPKRRARPAGRRPPPATSPRESGAPSGSGMAAGAPLWRSPDAAARSAPSSNSITSHRMPRAASRR